ncbi:MAG: alpha-amylase, partial [Treponema sp.]|nr:alpha-amylase [Treponema sp.]
MHIRDWSRAVNSTSTGKFTELADDEIINHLKDLGITHVQILPMFDYAQVNADENYNWGYNPYHYNVPEGRYVDYSANPDGTAAVAQMRTMISKLHDAGIAVIMDVVYNHTSGTGTGSLYDSTVPYYYYRMKSDGSYSNGSGCGNETNSAAPMFKKYMIDSLKHWMLDYHINGFRFDLMGLHEQETMKEIYDTLKQIDQKVMVYGEPWTGGTSLVNNSATVVVASGDSGYGAFEDGFRNTVKGSEFGGFEVGQVQGVNSDAAIINGLKCVNTGHNKTGITGLSIHYVECHDNFTLYDKLVYSLNLSETQAADRNGNIATKWNAALAKLNLTTVKKQDKLAAAYVLLSQGTPFINGGQDFLRTKKGNPDSYAADKKGGITWTNGSGVYNIDDVNTIDLSFKNTGKYDDVYNTYKGLIALRKSSTAFTSPISCTAENIGGNNDGVVKYTCTGADGTYVVYFNGSDKLYASGSYGVSGTEIKVASGAVVVGETIDSTTSLSLAPTSFQIIKLN